MLTDIFAYRYQEQPIWSVVTDADCRLLVQAMAVIKEVLPYWTADGKVDKPNEAKWKSLHDRLSRELGVTELAPRYYSTRAYTWDVVCDRFVTTKFDGQVSADQFMKERISFIELAFRLKGVDVAVHNASLPQAVSKAKSRENEFHRLAADFLSSAVIRQNRAMNLAFESGVDELNERFRRARAPLSYHNGFIQFALDPKIEQQIAKPFWDLVSIPLWTNVDIDMKEALDVRDSNGKDPAFFAAKALESAVKIVSDSKNWTRGTENGAAQYVDNLVSKANGPYLAVWEGEMLKDYFRKVRNSVGHGPGSEPMPELTLAQTDWAIEAAMSWVRTLVRRM